MSGVEWSDVGVGVGGGSGSECERVERDGVGWVVCCGVGWGQYQHLQSILTLINLLLKRLFCK